LGISLLFLLIVSLTAGAVSAAKDHFDPSWGPKSKAAYINAYNPSSAIGFTIELITDIPTESMNVNTDWTMLQILQNITKQQRLRVLKP
jgi:hypothetical protein